jgi:hypothetical protein
MAGRTGAGHARRMRRALAALAIGAAAATGVGACSPITTALEYAPSDGSRVELGDEIEVSNLLVLTEALGEPALVVGAVTNLSSEATSVTLEFAGSGGEPETVTLQVAGGSTALLDPTNEDGETVTLSASPVAPGANVTVTVSTPTAGSVTANVVVLDGTLAPYDEYLELIGD